MIKNTYQLHSEGVLSAYKDNAAVLTGTRGGRFLVNAPVEEAPPTQPPITLVINWPGALPPK